MELVHWPCSLAELPPDVVMLVAKELVHLSSRQFMRFLLVSKKPCTLIEYLPELELPAHLTQRRLSFDSLRVGPFFTRQDAIDRFWTLPSIKSLQHLNLSYMNITKPILHALDACAPTLATLRLTGSSGANKFWETRTKFPKLRVLDCWGFTFPSQVAGDELLNFVTNQCGNGLKEFHMSGNLPYDSVKRTTPAIVPFHFNKLTLALLPHCKTLEFIHVRMGKPPPVDEFIECLTPFINLKILEYPLTFEVANSICNCDGDLNLQLQECLDWIDSFSRLISEANLSEGFSIHSLVESVAPDATVRCCTYGLYDVILRRLKSCRWPLFKGKALSFLSKELPQRGFRPSPMSFIAALEFQTPCGRYDTEQLNSIAKCSNSLLKYFAIDCGVDATVPVLSRTGATALHLGLDQQSLRNALVSYGVPLPKWLENSENISRLCDFAGRTPFMYQRIREHHLRRNDRKAIEIRDNNGNSVFHYIMSEYMFCTSVGTRETLSLVSTIETLNSIQSRTIEQAINHYGVSAHSLLASSFSHPLTALTRMAPLPDNNDSFWSCISVEEPIFTRLIGMRVNSGDELQTSPLAPLLKQVFQTASQENLNAKVYGPKRNLPFLHAAVEAEAVWIFKVLLEIPDTWSLIDMNALDYMGRTALHVAVTPRKDSVFPTSELVKMLLSLGMSPTILDKDGWTAAMRVSANKECLRFIGGFLTEAEKRHQSRLFLQKQRHLKGKRK